VLPSSALFTVASFPFEANVKTGLYLPKFPQIRKIHCESVSQIFDEQNRFRGGLALPGILGQFSQYFIYFVTHEWPQ
jgi:hypothetical protein